MSYEQNYSHEIDIFTGFYFIYLKKKKNHAHIIVYMNRL